MRGLGLWREPYLVEQTYQILYRVVREHIVIPSDVLDLGCGTGYLSLELAREGCNVTALDVDQDAIEVARRSQQAGTTTGGRELVSYEVADVHEWQAGPRSFDFVIASRVLHHVDDLDGVVDNIRAWLRPGGKLVCVEFGYDRFDRRAASWLYEVQGILEASGCRQGDLTNDDARTGIERLWNAWWRHHEQDHRLHTYSELANALNAGLVERHEQWLPYLYWEALESLALPSETGMSVARFVRELEHHLIREGHLSPVLFAWVGDNPP